MQKLVYQNYNKFITATDTIKKMKTQVGSMEGEMASLSKAMDEILDTSNLINRNLATKREKIEKLSNVSSTLKKLQFLLDLPKRLNEALLCQSYSIAVQYYNTAEKIFDKYKNLESFQSIEKETNDIMNKLKKILRDSVSHDNIPRQKNIENHKLLFLLGEDPIELLQDFLLIREKELRVRLIEFKVRKEEPLINNINELNKRFIQKFFDTLKLFKTVFIVPETEKYDLMKPYAESVKTIFKEYFQIVNGLFGETQLIFEENLKEKMLEDLRNTMSNFSNELALVDEAIPQAEISKLISASLYQIVFRFLKENFKVMNDKLIDQMENFKSFVNQKKENIDEKSSNFANQLFVEYYSNSKQLQQFIEINDQYLTLKNQDIVKDFKDFSLGILGYILDFVEKNSYKKSEFRIASNDDKTQTTPTGALMLCRFLLEMSKQVVPKFQEVLAKLDTSTSLKSLITKFSDASQKMLIYYIEKQSFLLSDIIQVGFENQNWKDNEPPTGVKQMINVIVSEMDDIVKEISIFFPEDDDEKSESTSFSSEVGTSFAYKRNFGTLEDNAITKDVLKIFNKSLTKLAVTNPEYKKNSILTEILKISLKTFDECVRQITFSKNGYQQIQVDTHYLQMMWRDLIDDENFVRSLLSDIFNVAAERCLDPTPLQPSIVSSLCSKK